MKDDLGDEGDEEEEEEEEETESPPHEVTVVPMETSSSCPSPSGDNKGTSESIKVSCSNLPYR